MSIESVKNEIKNSGYDLEFIYFENSTATVDLAAKALNTHPNNIAKSLAIELKNRYIIVLTSGESRLDNKKFKKVFKEKARFISPNSLEEITGHPIGGVTPFGLKPGIKVYLDESLKSLDTIYPAGGSSNTCIKIKVNQLVDILDSSWVDVCK